MVDLSAHKLGLGPHESPRKHDLLLANYVADAGRLIEEAQVPAASSWRALPTSRGSLPVRDTDPLGNLEAGCCFFSAVAHHVRMVGQHVDDASLCPSTADVIAEYSRRTGYDPATGANDVGFTMLAGLDIWSREGFYGTRAVAWAHVGKSPAERLIANWLGCGTIGGFSLPLRAQRQVDEQGRQLWSVPAVTTAEDAPASWGRHAIYRHSTSPKISEGTSWGIDDTCFTTEWDDRYGDENILVLTDRWLRGLRAPNGFALEDLLSDARARGAIGA